MKPFPPTHTLAEPWTFPRKVLLVAFALLLALIAWQLLDLIMLTFGAVIVATVLRSLAAALERHARVPSKISVMAALLLVLFMIAAVSWLVGEPLAKQFDILRQRLPAAVDAVMQWLNSHRLGVAALQYIEEARSKDASSWAIRVAGAAGSTFGALGGAALVLVMGLYLAVAPRVYRDGLVRLMPLSVRQRVGEALDACGIALSRWLLGQSVSMLFVGVTTALGLWLLDVPLAFSVGVLSGLLAFIPFFGAIAGGLLAVLLGFMQGPETALFVLILAMLIQQLEGNVLMPLVERWAVGLPPVLGIAATVMFGVLFGLLGVLLAAPAMIVLMVVVQRLYIKGVLEEGG
ncbi:AI-2E family transporter [Limnohabitans sp.]|jgi:predicted PurR-regulated permease PerM|uniref:AI-2E family transporter n=1 Tax=Limnohabitans sp. TaxID=1907725 RepID=UPI0037C0BF3B